MKSKFIPICLTTLLLTACTPSVDEEIVTSSVSVNQTETVLETTATTETVAETTASDYAFDEGTDKVRTYVEITDETLFYTCKYEQTGFSDSKDFSDAVLLEQAETVLRSSQIYTDLYNEIKQRVPDSVPALDISCEGVFTYDLDGDGTDEYAFIFSYVPSTDCTDDIMIQNVCGAIDANTPFSLVLCDNKGSCLVSDIRYAPNAELRILNYGEFAQFVISGGVSNNSSCADYFSYYDNAFEHELREFRSYEIQDETFLLHTMAQAPNAWLIFWNDDINGYVTPEAVAVSQEERDEIFEQLPLTEEEREDYKDFSICTIGNKYYSLHVANGFSLTFVKENGVFVRVNFLESYGLNERRMPMGREFEIPYAVNFDYDSALARVKM